ncbi:conjugal transfer protein TraN [Legionella sp. 16cNR16C]|uniref:conjugal transfer protein TraN n=1 Tax=Legionella sp. 16cNR16C TaxID=2905656 RepID=UPI001E650AE4|nr:conjugal transfer protein TraN [Legionella sp. 16cNR16C]MCE3045408.1 conjugal transfer protein TraN [Legionella sp. 16cNR16C]
MIQLRWILLLFLLASNAYAQGQDDALHARDEALAQLKQFNPGLLLPQYTDNPKETALAPAEGSDGLKGQGALQWSKDATASMVMREARLRPRVHANPKSQEGQYAETLLDHADKALDGQCYVKEGECQVEKTVRTCEDIRQFSHQACGEALQIDVNSISQSKQRSLVHWDEPLTVPLMTCLPLEWDCNVASLYFPTASCHQLLVTASSNGILLPVVSQPTCQNPVVRIDTRALSNDTLMTIQFTITEKQLLEHWVKEDCGALDSASKAGNCFVANVPSCINPNETRVINGMPVTRSCWRIASDYACEQGIESHCQDLLNTGCSQTGSRCQDAVAGFCVRYEQTFACQSEHCFPSQTICLHHLGCADGECDASQEEASEDAAEGIARLGALAGVASEVAQLQVDSGMPQIFSGKNARCRIAVAGVGNCCGGKARLLNCREEEKRLSQAIEEGRAAQVGTYCAHKAVECLEEKESWCVFPSKLSGILQIQGRFGQLHIGFGEAHDKTNAPDCRGMTPEELERIDFSLLDLSAIEADFQSRRQLPNEEALRVQTESAIDRLNQEGQAHGYTH